MKNIILMLIISTMILTVGCRRVTVISDSILSEDKQALFQQINNNESWVYTDYIFGGTTAYNSYIHDLIYTQGLKDAFSFPDAVVLSFGTNDINAVMQGVISYESAMKSFWRLADQAAESGSRCVVLFKGSTSYNQTDINMGGNAVLNQWFYDLAQKQGNRSYLGFNYKFIIADMSAAIESNRAYYLKDFVHLSPAGNIAAGQLIKNVLNQCPSGRWQHGTDTLKAGETAALPAWHLR
jgi:lysophospholipase L1-like esterase